MSQPDGGDPWRESYPGPGTSGAPAPAPNPTEPLDPSGQAPAAPEYPGQNATLPLTYPAQAGYGDQPAGAPPYGAPQPQYGAPQPQYGAPQYGTAQPGYGQPANAYGAPAAAPGYGYGQPYGYADPGTAWALAQDAESARSRALVCLIVSAVLLFLGGILAIPSVILAAMAMSKAATDPPASRKLVTWAWALLGVMVVLGIALIGLFITAMSFSTT